MSPTLTYIKAESVNSQLALVKYILESQIPIVLHLDNNQTVKLGDALDRINEVREWLTMWQGIMEERAKL